VHPVSLIYRQEALGLLLSNARSSWHAVVSQLLASMRSSVIVLALVCLLAIGCTCITQRQDRSVEIKDERLADTPYVKRMLVDVQAQWERLLKG
jgi:hypothetical protein